MTTRTATVRGYWGVAAYMPKTETNIGTLWRSATIYQAAFLATVGRRYRHQASDTPKTPRRIPLHHYTDIGDLIDHLPDSCVLVGVELDTRATALTRFSHPPAALYLLGAEDHGLPERVLNRCHAIVQVPTPVQFSHNVATAGALVMHDRYLKTRRDTV